MDQVVWLRYLSLTFGNTTLATATLLAVFMGGLGLGAPLFGRLADRLRRPLLAYAVLQICVALIAVLSPWLFAGMDRAYVAIYQELGNQPVLFFVARAVLAALFLLPPTLLMGGTLPLVLRAVTAAGSQLGRSTALLYALNTLGAVAGVALAGFVTIRLSGLQATLLLAAGLDLLAGLGCLLLSRPCPVSAPTEESPRTLASQRFWLLALFFAMGATSLGLEVLWTRILVFYLGSSVYAYSLMLVLFLAGVGFGSLLAAPWVDRLRHPLRALALVEMALAVWGCVQVLLFFRLNAILLNAAEWLQPQDFLSLAGAQLLALLPVLGPPTLLMGISFPLAVRAFHRSQPSPGRALGLVYGSNTLGAVVGSLAAGFALIPLLGTQNSLLVLAAVNGVLGAFLWSRSLQEAFSSSTSSSGRSLRFHHAFWLLPAAVLGTILFLPPDRVVLAAGMFRDDQAEDLVYFNEDVSASVTIRRLLSQAGPYLSLELNGVNVAGSSPELYAVQKMQGHLPMLLADQPRKVAHIGFGSGGTAHAVSTHPVEEILIIEISPAVLAASGRYFGDINHGVLTDPRTQVELNDGRNFILATSSQFDAVLSDSIHPRYSGNGSLYSLEYFRLLRERLAPGGAVSMWLPTYSLTTSNYKMIVKAFTDVFPGAVVWYEPSALNSFTIVTARLDGQPWPAASLERAFRQPAVVAELKSLGIQGPAEILACYLVGGRELATWLTTTPAHQDDLPAVEYESGALLHKELTWGSTFGELLAQRPDEPPVAYLAALESAEQERARVVWDIYTAQMKRHEDFLRRKVREKLLKR